MQRPLLPALAFVLLCACGAQDNTSGKQVAEAPAGIPADMQQAHMALVEPLGPDAYRPIDFSLYHVFSAQRGEHGRPFCTAMESAEAWRSVMQPAAIDRPQLFEPPEAIWRDHAILLVARLVAADPGQNLRVLGIRRTDSVLEVSYQLAEPAPGGAEFNWPIAVEVSKPLPPTIRFIENGRVVCEAAAASNTTP